MPGPRSMRALRDVSSYQFAYSNEEVVSSNSNNNGSKTHCEVIMLNDISMLPLFSEYSKRQQNYPLSF